MSLADLNTKLEFDTILKNKQTPQNDNVVDVNMLEICCSKNTGKQKMRLKFHLRAVNVFKSAVIC